jgi:hypothetical protein
MKTGLSALMVGIALATGNAYAGPDSEHLEARVDKVSTVVHFAGGTISRSVIDASKHPDHIETLSCKYGYVAVGKIGHPEMKVIDLTLSGNSKRLAAARKDCTDHNLTPNF